MAERNLAHRRANQASRGYPATRSMLGNLERLFGDDDFFSPLPLFGRMREDLTSAAWVPPVDIRETDEAYEVVADLPGMTKDDVELRVEDNLLTIRGERRWREEEGGQEAGWSRRERAYGTFTRSFTLPREVDSEDVKARFRDGVLNVSIPKSEKAKPRTIDIEG